MKKSLWTLFLVGLIALLLVACGGGADAPAEEDAAAEAPAAEEAADDAAAEPADAEEEMAEPVTISWRVSSAIVMTQQMASQTSSRRQPNVKLFRF